MSWLVRGELISGVEGVLVSEGVLISGVEGVLVSEE